MLSLCLASPASTRLPRARRQSATHVCLRRPVVHARRCTVRAAAAGPEAVPSSVSRLTDDLRLLETERDEAVRVGEECARTVVKLEEMVRLLEQLAVNKVQEGDDEGARKVLQEKLSVQDVLAKTSSRATTNFALASKLAEKIGQQQAEIMTLLRNSSSSSSSSSSSGSQPASQPSSSSSSSGFYHYSRSQQPSSPAAPSTPAPTNTSSSYSPMPSSSSSSSRSEGDTSSTYTDTGSSSGSSSSSGGYEAPWEKSLREARQRVAEVEAAAAAAGRAADYNAKETIEEARERLRQQAYESVSAARSRIQRSASESIAEAQARIAAQDAAALAEVHKVIDRYKAGGYVSEAELDWAFAQLERRSWRG